MVGCRIMGAGRQPNVAFWRRGATNPLARRRGEQGQFLQFSDRPRGRPIHRMRGPANWHAQALQRAISIPAWGR
jgi:hypothetical protein